MSHISTSKDRYREGLCRGLLKNSVKDGKELVGSFTRQEKVLNKELHSLSSAERRVLSKLDDKIKELGTKHGSLPDVRGEFDRMSVASHASRRSRASTINADHEIGRHNSPTRKAPADSRAALCRLPSSPLPRGRLSSLKNATLLSSSVPEALNLTGEIHTSPSTQSLEDVSEAGSRKVKTWMQSGFLGADLQRCSLPSLKDEALRSPRTRRKRSASLHDVTYAAPLQQLRDATPDSRQRSRASSLLLPSDLHVITGMHHGLPCRHKRLPPSPLADKKRVTTRSCYCYKSASLEDLQQEDAPEQTELDPNSVEVLRQCRYLRIP